MPSTVTGDLQKRFVWAAINLRAVQALGILRQEGHLITPAMTAIGYQALKYLLMPLQLEDDTTAGVHRR